MIELGSTFRFNLPPPDPRHIWVVLSDPSKTDGKILFVNFTSLKQSSPDDWCILNNSDYFELNRETTVAYSLSKIGDAASLDNADEEGTIYLLEPIPEATLKKIVDAARTCPDLSKAKKALLPPKPQDPATHS